MEYQCDDGNLEDGDGCSSTCTVETNFRCLNGSSSGPSVCVYNGVPLGLTLRSIQRAEDQDRGIFQFDVYPPLFTINRMHLSQHVLLDCNATYSIVELSYSNGVL